MTEKIEGSASEVVRVNGVPVGTIADLQSGLRTAPAEPEGPREAAAWAKARTVTLPSGKVVQIRAAKGRDVVRVQTHMEAQSAKGMAAFTLRMIAQIARCDGNPIMFEDLEEWPAADLLVLEGEVAADFGGARQEPSPS